MIGCRMRHFASEFMLFKQIRNYWTEVSNVGDKPTGHAVDDCATMPSDVRSDAGRSACCSLCQ